MCSDRVQHEGGEDQGQDDPALDQQRAVVDRLPLVQGHHLGLPLLRHRERTTEQPRQHHHEHGQRHEHDRRHVDQEVVELQTGTAADDDVGRVADQGRRTADVGGEDLGDQERHRIDVEPITHQEGDRGHQQHRGHVVQERRGQRGDQHEQDHHSQRGALGPLGRPDGQELEHPGLPQHADDDHHAQQQEDHVPVRAGLVGEEGLLRRQRAHGEQDAGAAEGGDHFWEALDRDQHEGSDEDRDRGQGHGGPISGAPGRARGAGRRR